MSTNLMSMNPWVQVDRGFRFQGFGVGSAAMQSGTFPLWINSKPMASRSSARRNGTSSALWAAIHGPFGLKRGITPNPGSSGWPPKRPVPARFRDDARPDGPR